jgi:hypothetical protein
MMSGTRPSVFDEDIDLSRFAPKTGPEKPAVAPETVRRISEEGGFPSRAPVPATPGITQRAHDRYHEIVEAERARYEAGEITHRVTLGEVVERALAALEREIRQKGHES